MCSHRWRTCQLSLSGYGVAGKSLLHSIRKRMERRTGYHAERRGVEVADTMAKPRHLFAELGLPPKYRLRERIDEREHGLQ
jgi:hypothetical protein